MNSERPKLIPGYKHPDNTTVSRGTKYKTFTEGQKPKKKERFGSTLVGNKYASYNTQQTKKSKQELEKERETFETMNSQKGGK